MPSEAQPASKAAAQAPLVRVLLTGGPGAGKSSALATLRDRISKRGFQVIVVPETATALLDSCGGYDPSWHGTPKHVRMQEMFLKFQVANEETLSRFAELRPERPHLLLLDRGCLDGKLFCTEQEWAQVLEGAGVSEDALLERYDLVVHMTTVAARFEGLYDYGPGSSNPARYHTPEQARHADEMVQAIYAKHPHVRVVPNFAEFSDKIETVVRCVTEAVQVDGLAEPREREVIQSASEPLNFASWPVEVDVYDIEVTYLDGKFTESLRRRQLMTTAARGDVDGVGAGDSLGLTGEPPAVIYELRQDIQLNGRNVGTRKVLTYEAYKLLKQARAATSTELRKRAVCFTWQGSYYEVSTYFDSCGGAVPAACAFSGCRVLDRPRNAPAPPWLLPEGVGAVGRDAPASTAAPEPAAAAPPPPAARRQLSRNATAEVASGLSELLARRGLAGESQFSPKQVVISTDSPRGTKRRLEPEALPELAGGA